MNAVAGRADPACSEGQFGLESAADVASPCVGICSLHPTDGYCLGCWRDLKDIATWSSMTAAERRAVLARVAERRGPAGATEENA